MTFTLASRKNGTPMHYFANPGEPCHPAVVAGAFVTEDEVVPSSCDLIQLDTELDGVIVPLRRAAVSYDAAEAAADGTCHFPAKCQRD